MFSMNRTCKNHRLFSFALATAGLTAGAALAGPPGDARLGPVADRPLAPCEAFEPPPQRGVYSVNYWLEGIVPYEFNANVSNAKKAAMLEAMNELMSVSTVNFVLRSNQTDYVHIQDANVNNSSVGRVGGMQVMNIYNWNKKYVMVHELFHALGARHEQARADRDQYIQIEWDRIVPGMEHNFEMRPTAQMFGSYDFDSIMHYGSCGFSTCQECDSSDEDCRTITVLPPYQWAQSSIGQLDHLSDGDILMLQHMYPLPPVNDYCQNAVPISAGSFSFDNRAAGDDSTSSCDSGVESDIWYTFTTVCACTVTIDTCGSTSDTVLSVYTGDCNNRIPVACNDGAGLGSDCAGSDQSSVTFAAAAETTYLLCIGSPALYSAPGQFSLSMSSDTASNPVCGSAMVISPNSVTPFDTTCGAVSGSASCATNAAPALWYSFTALYDGSTAIDVCDASYDSVLSVFEGNCGNLQEVACNDDLGQPTRCAQPFASLVSLEVTAGTTYWIRVSGYNYEHGQGTLTVSTINANSSCGSPEPIDEGNNPFDLVYGLADEAHIPPACGNSAAMKALWYEYTASCDTLVTLDTCVAGSLLDTVISVETGPCYAPIAVACNDNSGSCATNAGASALTFHVSEGNTYRIRVSSNNNAGAGTIHLQTLGVPSNGTCATAQAVGTGTTNFDASCAPAADITGSCGPSGHTSSLWFSYTSECSGVVTMNTCGSAYDTVLSVYSGACGHLTLVTCNDDNAVPGAACSNSVQSHVTFGAVAGTTYLVRVSSNAGEGSTGRLTITGANPSNGSCGSALVAESGATVFSTLCAPVNGFAACANSYTSPAIWFTYRPDCTGEVTLDTCGSNYDTVVSVYTGTCGNLTSVACNDDVPGNGPCRGTTSRVTFAGDDRTTYRIRVSGWSGQAGNGVMNLSCTPVECRCDWNNSGTLTSQDFFDFLVGFFSGHADYDNSGTTTSQDFFDFIACFFTGC